jgi:hypothetical protein
MAERPPPCACAGGWALWGARTAWALLLAVVVATLLANCALIEPPTPTPTPTPVYEVRAWVALPRPGWGQEQTLYTKLTAGGEGVEGAQMHAILHYQVGDRRVPAEGSVPTDADGIAEVTFGIDDAGAGYTVFVDVIVEHEAGPHTAIASFVPQC